MEQIQIIKQRHETARRRDPTYSRTLCPNCGRETYHRHEDYQRSAHGPWRQRLTCQTCGHAWTRWALPCEQKRLDRAHPGPLVQLTLLEA